MNCKPGDLCRIISTPETEKLGTVGHFVTVREASLMRPHIWREARIFWTFEGPFFACGCGCGRPIDLIADDVLRPLRDPGDDVKSEDVRDLPADAKQTSGEAWV